MEAGYDDLGSGAGNDDGDLGSENDVEAKLRQAERYRRISPSPAPACLSFPGAATGSPRMAGWIPRRSNDLQGL
jgi:hypothetical protein